MNTEMYNAVLALAETFLKKAFTRESTSNQNYISALFAANAVNKAYGESKAETQEEWEQLGYNAVNSYFKDVLENNLRIITSGEESAKEFGKLLANEMNSFAAVN